MICDTVTQSESTTSELLDSSLSSVLYTSFYRSCSELVWVDPGVTTGKFVDIDLAITEKSSYHQVRQRLICQVATTRPRTTPLGPAATTGQDSGHHQEWQQPSSCYNKERGTQLDSPWTLARLNNPGIILATNEFKRDLQELNSALNNMGDALANISKQPSTIMGLIDEIMELKKLNKEQIMRINFLRTRVRQKNTLMWLYPDLHSNQG